MFILKLHVPNSKHCPLPDWDSMKQPNTRFQKLFLMKYLSGSCFCVFKLRKKINDFKLQIQLKFTLR